MGAKLGALGCPLEAHVRLRLDVLGHLRPQHTQPEQDGADPILGRVAAQVVSPYVFHPPGSCFFSPRLVQALTEQRLFLTGFFLLLTRKKKPKSDLRC